VPGAAVVGVLRPVVPGANARLVTGRTTSTVRPGVVTVTVFTGATTVRTVACVVEPQPAVSTTSLAAMATQPTHRTWASVGLNRDARREAPIMRTGLIRRRSGSRHLENGTGEAMPRAETEVVEVSRRDSVNGYAYEYDESLPSVKEIQRSHEQRLNWWQTRVDAKMDAEAA
jgi:hypothetical protein